MFNFDESFNLIEEAITENYIDEEMKEEELTNGDLVDIFESIMMDFLTEDEYNDFIASESYKEAINELVGDEVVEEAVRTRVKLSMEDEIRRLAKIAVFKIARQKKLLKMKKLEKAWANARRLEGELAKELGPEAIKMAKSQYANARKNQMEKETNKAKAANTTHRKSFFKYVKK